MQTRHRSGDGELWRCRYISRGVFTSLGLSGVNVTRRCQQEGLSLTRRRESVGTPSGYYPSESESATRATTSATRATTRLLPVRAVRERPLGSLPPLGICVPEPELTRTTAIMISFKLGKRQNRGSRAPIMIDRVSLRSARVLLCLALIPRRLMCDLHVICKT